MGIDPDDGEGEDGPGNASWQSALALKQRIEAERAARRN